MKSKPVRAVNLVQAACRFNRFPWQPLAVRTRELELVAVLVYMLRTEDGTDFRQFNLSDAGKVIHDLLLLVFELFLVGQDLPFAASADAEMLTLRLTPNGARLDQT